MATVDTQAPTEPAAPALPDYVTDPDAVLKDSEADWRYGRAPDYSKTRQVYAETKSMSHEAGSLPQLVENLVKNWEVEASFKPTLKDWRTVDHANYSFAINGGEPQTAEHMLKQGTYNAIISPNEYYSPEFSDFASSHKTFKRMMPTFAWEVLEVYSGPPTVSFRWRHWGVMKNDYVGFNNKAQKVTAPAHNRAIDIQGVTVATVNSSLQLQSVRTWFDPLDMFRQIAPDGVVAKENPIAGGGLSPGEALDAPSSASASASASSTTASGATAAAAAVVEEGGCPFSAGTIVGGKAVERKEVDREEGKAPFPPAKTNQDQAKEVEEKKGEGKARLLHPELEMSRRAKGILENGGQEGEDVDPHV